MASESLLLQRRASLQVQSIELLSGIQLGKMLCIHFIHPADFRSILVNPAKIPGKIYAHAIATVKWRQLGHRMDVSAALSTLGARKMVTFLHRL
jgi:hypothetical protein